MDVFKTGYRYALKWKYQWSKIGKYNRPKDMREKDGNSLHIESEQEI